ncbi:MAG: hypothetical protein QW597_02310 [Thermoplasmataceae archaeon]
MAYPTFLEPFSQELTVILLFLDGLFFGIAIKKALTSFILIVIGLLIAYFIGFSLVPKISVTNLISQVATYASSVHFGTFVVTFSILLFFIGLGIGIWKG